MRDTFWFRWAGRLVALGAVALAGTVLRADDDAAKPEAEKPRASDKEAAKEGSGGNPGRSAGHREAHSAEYWLGIETHPAGGLVRDQLSLPEGQGLVVESLVPESPAEKAGLKKNDILLTANDKPLEDVRQLIELLRAADGSAINFKLLRGGKETTLSITPGKRADSPSGHSEARREHLERALRQWREFAEQGGEPFRMQFFHPGMVLPPGAGRLPLPEGMRVTLTREGKKPAQIEVKQGEESWSGTEDELSKAPEKFRGPVALMLGPPLSGNAIMRLQVQGDAEGAVVPGPGQPGRGPEQPKEAVYRLTIRQPGLGAGPGDSIDQRLQEVIREVEKIRQELHNRRSGGPNPGPPGEREPRGEGRRPPRDRFDNDSPPPEK